MKLRLLVKMILMEIILGLKVTMDQALAKRFCFGYTFRFLTHALTLRLQYVYLRFLSIV